MTVYLINTIDLRVFNVESQCGETKILLLGTQKSYLSYNSKQIVYNH